MVPHGIIVITRTMVDGSHNDRINSSGKAIGFKQEPLGYRAWIIKFMKTQEVKGSLQVGAYSSATLIIRWSLRICLCGID